MTLYSFVFSICLHKVLVSNVVFSNLYRSALLEPMPLIEGSRSKNVLANSESSTDLLNEGNIPNGESTTSVKAKNINNTEVSVRSLFQYKMWRYICVCTCCILITETLCKCEY